MMTNSEEPDGVIFAHFGIMWGYVGPWWPILGVILGAVGTFGSMLVSFEAIMGLGYHFGVYFWPCSCWGQPGAIISSCWRHLDVILPHCDFLDKLLAQKHQTCFARPLSAGIGGKGCCFYLENWRGGARPDGPHGRTYSLTQTPKRFRAIVFASFFCRAREQPDALQRIRRYGRCRTGRCVLRVNA